VKLSFDNSKIIKDLSDAEFTELFVQQMRKESPGYTSQLVADKILIIQ
jgi:TorA maturation chaperone TorD